MKETFAIVAALLAVAGNVPYVRDILRQRVQPHPYTWFVGSVVSGIVLFGQIAKGAGVGAIPVVVAELFTILIFILSLRHGYKKIIRTDTYLLIIALLGVIPWVLTKDPTISIVIAVGIDLISFAPTLRKTWVHPESESPILYGSNVLRHVLTMFSLEAYNVATTIHSIAMICVNSFMVLCMLPRGRQK